jgi:hypothetical protein
MQVRQEKNNKSWAVAHLGNHRALRRLRQEDDEFQANLGHIERPCLKRNRKQ